MRPRVKARRLQMFAHIRDNRGCFDWQRDRRMLDHAIHVIDPEADPFQVERGDCAVERFCLLDQPRQLIVRGQRPHHHEQFLEAALRRLAIFGGHVGFIVNYS